MALETVNLEAFVANDILALFPEGFKESFWDGGFLNDVSFGDAEYTIISGPSFISALRSCWDDGDWATDAVWDRLFDDNLREVHHVASLVLLEG